MEVPPTPRRDEAAHRDAVEQLSDAREVQRDAADQADAAAGTDDEDRAAEALGKARRRVAAREAWAVWTERGVIGGPDGR